MVKRNNNGFIATAVLYTLITLVSMVLFVVLQNLKTTRTIATNTVREIKNDLIYYEVLYNGNGNDDIDTVMENTRIYVGKETKLAKNMFVKDGYKFIGWALSPEGAVVYQDEEVLIPTTSPDLKVNLYAKWKRNRFWLEVDPNGGSYNGTTNVTKYEKYENHIDVLPLPVREGYTFLGWEHRWGETNGEYAIENSSDMYLKGYGTSLYLDESFANGMNHVQEYQGKNEDGVVIERVATTSDNPIKNTGFMLKVTTSNKLGGIYQETKSQVLGTYYHVVVAKVPEGNRLEIKHDQIGEASDVKWITSNEGTGKFETYIYKINCGFSGEFSNFGYLVLEGNDINSSNPIIWYISYSAIVSQNAGESLYQDTYFEEGMNSVEAFQKGGNPVKITKVKRSNDSLLKDANSMLKIEDKGNTLGGFKQESQVEANGVYYHLMYAKVPTGYMLKPSFDSIGNNGRNYWLTSNEGTGKWEQYLYRTEAGETGDFTTFGQVYLENKENKSDEVTWDLGYTNIYDATDLKGNYSVYTYEFQEWDAKLTAKWRVSTYKIKFDVNGGVGAVDTQVKTHGITMKIPTTRPTKAGKVFLGWSTSPTATSPTWAPGGNFTADVDVTLYAVYGPPSITITLDYYLSAYTSNPEGGGHAGVENHGSSRGVYNRSNSCGRGWGDYWAQAVSTTKIDVTGYNYLTVTIQEASCEKSAYGGISIGGVGARSGRCETKTVKLNISHLTGSYPVVIDAHGNTNSNVEQCISANSIFSPITLSAT